MGLPPISEVVTPISSPIISRGHGGTAGGAPTISTGASLAAVAAAASPGSHPGSDALPPSRGSGGAGSESGSLGHRRGVFPPPPVIIPDAGPTSPRAVPAPTTSLSPAAVIAAAAAGSPRHLQMLHEQSMRRTSSSLLNTGTSSGRRGTSGGGAGGSQRPSGGGRDFAGVLPTSLTYTLGPGGDSRSQFHPTSTLHEVILRNAGESATGSLSRHTGSPLPTHGSQPDRVALLQAALQEHHTLQQQVQQQHIVLGERLSSTSVRFGGGGSGGGDDDGDGDGGVSGMQHDLERDRISPGPFGAGMPLLIDRVSSGFHNGFPAPASNVSLNAAGPDASGDRALAPAPGPGRASGGLQQAPEPRPGALPPLPLQQPSPALSQSEAASTGRNTAGTPASALSTGRNPLTTPASDRSFGGRSRHGGGGSMTSAAFQDSPLTGTAASGRSSGNAAGGGGGGGGSVDVDGEYDGMMPPPGILPAVLPERGPPVARYASSTGAGTVPYDRSSAGSFAGGSVGGSFVGSGGSFAGSVVSGNSVATSHASATNPAGGPLPPALLQQGSSFTGGAGPSRFNRAQGPPPAPSASSFSRAPGLGPGPSRLSASGGAGLAGPAGAASGGSFGGAGPSPLSGLCGGSMVGGAWRGSLVHRGLGLPHEGMESREEALLEESGSGSGEGAEEEEADHEHGEEGRGGGAGEGQVQGGQLRMQPVGGHGAAADGEAELGGFLDTQHQPAQYHQHRHEQHRQPNVAGGGGGGTRRSFQAGHVPLSIAVAAGSLYDRAEGSGSLRPAGSLDTDMGGPSPSLRWATAAALAAEPGSEDGGSDSVQRGAFRDRLQERMAGALISRAGSGGSGAVNSPAHMGLPHPLSRGSNGGGSGEATPHVNVPGRQALFQEVDYAAAAAAAAAAASTNLAAAAAAAAAVRRAAFSPNTGSATAPGLASASAGGSGGAGFPGGGSMAASPDSQGLVDHGRMAAALSGLVHQGSTASVSAAGLDIGGGYETAGMSARTSFAGSAVVGRMSNAGVVDSLRTFGLGALVGGLGEPVSASDLLRPFAEGPQQG